jgi:HNH endonuclease
MKTYIRDNQTITVDSPDIERVIDRSVSIQEHALRIAYKSSGEVDSVMLFSEGKWWRLHRYIMAVHKSDSAIYVDHINGNVLDNRLSNLRLCTNAQNQMNARPHIDKESKLPKGVTLSKSNPKFPYQVRISVLGRRIQVGYFETVEQAEKAYLLVAEGLHGQFAYHTSRGVKHDS